MANGFIDDATTKTAAQHNDLVYSDDDNYATSLAQRAKAVALWQTLKAEERSRISGGYEAFLVAQGVGDLRPGPGKNRYLLKAEAAKRVSDGDPLKLLPISSLEPASGLLDLVANVENELQIKEVYRIKKRLSRSDKNSGLNSDEAINIKNCLRQGRELFGAGLGGPLMVKPLNHFYSLTAYAYASIILNNPIRFALGTLPGSHGFVPDLDAMKVAFGGDAPRGTFSELVCSFPTITSRNSKFDLLQDTSGSVLLFEKQKHVASLGALFSMLPEIREYYSIVTGRSSRTYPLEISLGPNLKNITWQFNIGDGETIPPKPGVEAAFFGLSAHEKYGKVVVDVPVAESSKIAACIYTDAGGRMWYVDNPFAPVILPELALHFLLLGSLSTLMRYRPRKWGDILLNEGNSDVVLLIRKYVSAFEQKFPFLVLRTISRFYPLLSAER